MATDDEAGQTQGRRRAWVEGMGTTIHAKLSVRYIVLRTYKVDRGMTDCRHLAAV